MIRFIKITPESAKRMYCGRNYGNRQTGKHISMLINGKHFQGYELSNLMNQVSGCVEFLPFK